jgi:hypothetical protein
MLPHMTAELRKQREIHFKEIEKHHAELEKQKQQLLAEIAHKQRALEEQDAEHKVHAKTRSDMITKYSRGENWHKIGRK